MEERATSGSEHFRQRESTSEPAEGASYFKSIIRTLQGWSGTGHRELLASAAAEYWSAAFTSHLWPREMRNWGERINRLIFSRGVIEKTVGTMDDKTAHQAADELLRFARFGLESFVEPAPDSVPDLVAGRSKAGLAVEIDAGAHESGVPQFRVLVVEDSMAVAQIFALILAQMGHEVHTVADGPTALARIGRIRPDVVFSDISMPLMDGYELARRLREQPEFRGVPLIAMTACEQDEARDCALEAGFDRHVVKPPDLERLESLFAEIADRCGRN